jgi:hypothetical protein
MVRRHSMPKRQKMVACAAVVALLVVAVQAAATESGHHDLTIEEAVSQIRSELGLADEERIDPDAVPAPLLEQLGDAVMADMAGSEAHHEWMDTMMGGEGSESLASTHRWMGYRYLTGGYGPYGPGPGPDGRWGDDQRRGWSAGPGGGFGMHGGWGRGHRGGMMGPGMMGRWGMMGNPQWGRQPPAAQYESPEEIARRRYAAGEITREEYRRIMEELERTDR